MRYMLLVAAIVIADQATKHWVRLALPPGISRPVIPGLVYLTHVQNTGAAFGLLRGYAPLLVAVTTAVLVVAYLNRNNLAQERPVLRLGYALGIAGAVGNLVDRLLFGRVTDFIDLRFFPVFNLADTAITFGVILLVWGMATDRQEPGKGSAHE